MLAAMWGDSDATFENVSADLYALPESEGYETLVARLANNPDFARFVSEERLRDAELRIAEAHARSNLTVRAGVRKLHDTNDEAFVFGVTIPLFARSRARSEVAAANATARADGGGARSAPRERRGAALRAVSRAAARDHGGRDPAHVRSARDGSGARGDSRYAFERGRYSYLEWVDAQRELVDVQRPLIDASANAHLYRTEIERLTGDALGN